MKKFAKININNIPVEDAHGGSGKRQMLLSRENVASSHWEAVTKGFLKNGDVFDWHLHENIDEMFVVLQGRGKFSCEKEEIDYSVDDVIMIPANLRHKIEAVKDSEFYFIRVKV